MAFDLGRALHSLTTSVYRRHHGKQEFGLLTFPKLYEARSSLGSCLQVRK
jgi:hypothetical protein